MKNLVKLTALFSLSAITAFAQPQEARPQGDGRQHEQRMERRDDRRADRMERRDDRQLGRMERRDDRVENRQENREPAQPQQAGTPNTKHQLNNAGFNNNSDAPKGLNGRAQQGN
jgi:Ni/Co efflux regulator RcnB